MRHYRRLDLFETFSAPIHIVDQMHYEITKPANDPGRKVAAWLQRMGNPVVIEETLVGLGFRAKLERGETPSGSNLGEIAVDEYATQIALHSYNELVAIAHYNGRQMPGHRPMPVAPETRALLRQIARPLHTRPK